MSKSTAVVTQSIMTFTSEGVHRSIAAAMKDVNDALGKHVNQLNSAGGNAKVVSISHNSGFIGHIGCYASIIAVINW